MRNMWEHRACSTFFINAFYPTENKPISHSTTNRLFISSIKYIKPFELKCVPSSVITMKIIIPFIFYLHENLHTKKFITNSKKICYFSNVVIISISLIELL